MFETMRTRCLPSMTNEEVEQYLKRNDIIIIPVGTVETHGMYPLDCEYVLAEAYARLIAEQVDGLVLPNLLYFHPGATQTGRGTVHMSMSDGFEYCTAIAESLLQQGFRRQIWIPGHQPTSQFLLPMVTQFFDDNKCPIFYLDMMAFLQAHGENPFAGFGGVPKIVSDDEGLGCHATMIGAYKICERMEDFPTGAEVNCERYLGKAYTPSDGYMALFELLKARPTLLSCSPAFYYSDVAQHGSQLLPETREEIEREGELGAEHLRQQVAKCDFVPIMEALRQVDRYQNTVIMEKHGDHLPRNKWCPNTVKEFKD